MSFKGFVKDSEGLSEEVCCAPQGHMNLLESLLPSSFLVEGLKTAMMFIQDRLFRIEHETIDSCHMCPPFVWSRCTVTDPVSIQQ